jgi:hypothetical protein
VEYGAGRIVRQWASRFGVDGGIAAEFGQENDGKKTVLDLETAPELQILIDG